MRNDGELLEAEIVDLTHDGKGVADLGGRRVFVAGALPEERVLIAVRGRRRRYQEAELVDVLRPSSARTEAACEYFGRCGGCVLQHAAYDAQIRYKEAIVRDAFTRIAGVEPAHWLAPVTGPAWRYRRRARLGVKFVEGKGRVLVGFRERAAPLITDMARCPILAPPVDGMLAELGAVIAASTVKRRLPQIEVAVGENATAVVLRVLETPTAEDRQAFLALGERFGVDMYLQTGGPGTVTPLAGVSLPLLSYRLPRFELTLEFAPTDFVQVNAAVNAALVEAVVTALEILPTDRVLDLYCGLGNFSLPLARRAAAVTGVEGEAGLVARAASNARLNDIQNASFLVGDLSEPAWSFLRQPWDLVVLDPPRTGAAAVTACMAGMRPRRLVYVSCHAGTLARDTRELVQSQGYALRAAGVLDMFPHTHHAEVMAVFDRRS